MTLRRLSVWTLPLTATLAVPFGSGCTADDASAAPPPVTDAGKDSTMSKGGCTPDKPPPAVDGGSPAQDSAAPEGGLADGAEAGAGDASFADSGASLDAIGHVVVIFLENHSFDNLFGSWPGAEGILHGAVAQVGPDGKPYTTLPEYGPYPAG